MFPFYYDLLLIDVKVLEGFNVFRFDFASEFRNEHTSVTGKNVCINIWS